MEEIAAGLAARVEATPAAGRPATELRLDYEATCTCHRKQEAELEKRKAAREKAAEALAEADRLCGAQADILEQAASAKREAFRRLQATEVGPLKRSVPLAEPASVPPPLAKLTQMQMIIAQGPDSPSITAAYEAFLKELPTDTQPPARDVWVWTHLSSELATIVGAVPVPEDDAEMEPNDPKRPRQTQS